MSSTEPENFPNGIDEKYYHLMIESSLEGVLTADANFTITYANPKICALLGYTFQELVGKSFQSLIPSEELPDNLIKYQNRSQGKSESYARSLLGKTGKLFYCLVTAIPIFDKDNSFQGSLALVKDFSPQRAVIEKSLRSKKTYEALIENIPDVIARYDRGLHIIYINEAVKKIRNFPVDFYIGKKNEELGIPPAILANWDKQLRSVFHSKKEVNFDFEMMTTQGPHHFESRIVPEFAVDGSVETVFCITRDFSAKIQQMVKQEETDQKLNALIEQVAEAFLVHDATGKILDVNKHTCEILGYTHQELLSLSLFDIENDLNPEDARKHWQEARLGRTVTRFGHFKCKDGSLIPVETRVGCFEQNGQKIFLGITRDISLREKAEMGLLQANKRLQLAAQAAHLGIWEWDIQKDQLIWDDRMYELYGVHRKDFKPNYTGWQDTLLPEDVTRSDESMRQAVTGSAPYDTEFRVKLPEDGFRYLKAYGQVVKDAAGQPLRMLGVNFDITTFKWIENANRLMTAAHLQIAQAATVDEIHSIVGEAIKDMIEEDGFVVVTGLDEAIQGERIKVLCGPDVLVQTLTEEFNADPNQMVFYLKDIPPEELALLNSGKLTTYENGLYRLLAKKIPKSICRSAQKDLNIEHIYTIGYKWEEVHFGSVAIFTCRDLSPIAGLIEAVVNQAAISFKKMHFENLFSESEDRFRRIFEESPVGIGISTPDSKLTNVNPAFSKILGYTRAELIGVSYRELTHPDDVAENDRLNHELLKGTIPFFVMAKRYIRKDGQVIWSNLTVTAIRSQSGEVINFLAMIEDSTEKKKAQETLEHEQYLFQTLMDNSPDSIYFKDLEYRFIRANKTTAKKFGLDTVEDLLGKTDNDFFLPDLAKVDREEELEIFTSQEPVINKEVMEIWRDQRPATWSSSTKVPLKDEKGQIIGLFGITRDITDTKSKEEEIKHLNADLEKKVELRTKELNLRNQELESFVYSVSHDLKAPLRGITGYAQLLLQEHTDQLDEEGKSFLHKLVLSSEQLAQLVDDLLTYSRLDRRPVNKVDLNMAEIIGIVVDERASELKSKHITLHQNIEAETLCSSVELITQILRNLFDNAIKFSKPAGNAEIWIDYTNHGETSLFSIRDNGIGFDMKYSERIFDVFYRLGRMDEYSGTGIGLALVKKAAEIIGGRVWAESEPDRGATFYLEINKNDYK